MKCEVCGSDHVSRVSLVYEGGLSGSTSTHTLVGASQGGGLGGGVGRTNTVSQSALSARLAPPVKKRMRGGIITAVIALFFLLAIALPLSHNGFTASFVWWVIGVALGALAFWLIRRVARYNSGTWRQLRSDWENAFICMACSNTFVA